ncbi:MAG: hypothetical protein H0T62_06755 [Parachlamydiaceae bacterium]|nr:hypothetical protein [Parachlamydiaceae bacterium]
MESAQPKKHCDCYLDLSKQTSPIERGEKRRFDDLQPHSLVAQDENLSLKIKKVTKERGTESLVSEDHVRQLLESSQHLRRTSFTECKSYLSFPEHFQALKIVLWKSSPFISHQMLLHLLQRNRKENNWDFYQVILQEIFKYPNWCEGYLDELHFSLYTPQLCNAQLILKCPNEEGEPQINEVSVSISFPCVILCQFRYFADLLDSKKFQMQLTDKNEVVFSLPFILSQSHLKEAGEDFLNFATTIIEAQKTKKCNLMDYPTKFFYTTALLFFQIGEIDAFRSLLSRWNHDFAEILTLENYKDLIHLRGFLRVFPELLKGITVWMVEQSVKGQISFVELRDFFHAHYTVIISLKLEYALSYERIEFQIMKLLFGYFHALSFSKCEIVGLENWCFSRSLSTLQVLTFDNCTGITDEILRHLPPSLTSISIT